MKAAEGPPAGGGVASTLEKDLKELERLLKADASGGGSDAAEGNAALAAGSSVKQQLREVLRKLMEAYFAPAAVHKRETRSLLGLMKVALQRHAEVFTGSSTFCARAFAHLLPLVTCASLSENVSETIAWCLCQLATHISNAGDPGAFAAFLAGTADLAEDAAAVCAAHAGAAAHSWRGGHHAGHGHASVILAFGESMALIVAAESGPETPPRVFAGNRLAAGGRKNDKEKAPDDSRDAVRATDRGFKKNFAQTCALALEVSGVAAASDLACVACKLVAHTLRVAPQTSACLLSARAARAVASVSSCATVSHETRRAALAATRGVLTECAAELVSAGFVLPHLAATLRERAALAPSATPPCGKKRDVFDAELAACVDAAAERFLARPFVERLDDVPNASGRTRETKFPARSFSPRSSNDARSRSHRAHQKSVAPKIAAVRHLDAFAAACVSTLEAGEGATGAALRAAAIGAARACAATKPSAAAAMTPLLAHAGSADVADALVECMARAFFEERRENRGQGASRTGGRNDDFLDEKEARKASKRRRLSAGPERDASAIRAARDPAREPERISGPTGSADERAEDATLAWMEACVIAAAAQLGPPAGPAVGMGPSPAARARAAAGVARVAAALRRAKPRAALAATTRDWLKWARRAHDVGDGATAGAYAAVLGAADALARRPTPGDVFDEGHFFDERDRHGGASVYFLADEDLSAEALLLWPWSVGADEAPAEAKREAKIAALRTALAAVACRSDPSAAAMAAMKRALQAGFHDADDAVRAAAVSAAPASHLLLGLGAGGAQDARTPLGVIAKVAEARSTSARVRASVATAVGGIAAAAAALGGFARGGAAAATDGVLRALARDTGQRGVTAASGGDMPALAAAATSFDAGVTEAVERASERSAARAATAGGGARARAAAPSGHGAALPVADAARLLVTMLSLEEDADVAAAALAATPRVLLHASRGAAAHETPVLAGAASLASAATPLARHASPAVRDAFLAAAPALASRGALLDLAARDAGAISAMDVDGLAASGDAREPHRSVKDAGLNLLQLLKSNVEDAADAAARESALRAFAAAAAAMPHSDHLDAALIVMVHRLDDPDPGVRAAAVELVRAAAARKGVRPRELLLGNRLVAAHLGVKLPNAPGVLSVLSEALLRAPERAVLVELLPAAVPRLVERRDVDTLKLYAAKLGAEYDVATILHDWCYTAIADLINNAAARPAEEVQASMAFLTTHTGEALEVLVADHKKELMRALIRSAGADDAADPHTEAQRLGQVLGTLAKLAADGTATAGSDPAALPAVHDFLRPHFTWLVMGDASDRSGDSAAARRFLRSLTIMVHLIGPHLPQFAPKVMAHLTGALERPSARARGDALAAWLVVVKQLAKHAPDHLRAVAGRVVVAMLPHLPESASSASSSFSREGATASDGFPDGSSARRETAFFFATAFSFGEDDDPAAPAAAAANAAAAAAVIDELVLRSGKPIMTGFLARLPTLPECERLARANAAVREERGEIPLSSLLGILTDGLEDESQAVRATALGELRRALRADPAAVSDLLSNGEDEGRRVAGARISSRAPGGRAPGPGDGDAANDARDASHFSTERSVASWETSAEVVGRCIAALLRCCVSENRTAISLRTQRLAAACLGELGAIDPGRVDLPLASTEKLSAAADGPALARKLLIEHIARTVRGAADVDMLDAAAIAAQEILVHVRCRPASVRAEDVEGGSGGSGGASATGPSERAAISRDSSAYARLPEGASPEGEAFWANLPEEIRALLAPGLTSMYCLTRAPSSPPTRRPLYRAPGGPSFRRWLYAWCRALASEATGPDAPVFAVCAAGIFKHDTRVMLFLLPRMVLDALAARDAARVRNVREEIVAVLRDAAGAEGPEGPDATDALPAGRGGAGHPAGASSEQAELAAQAVFTLLDQLAAWKEDVVNGVSGGGASREDEETLAALRDVLRAVPRELLARAALRCGAPARALLYFEDHLRAQKNVLNQAALRDGEPEGGGLDDASAAFLAATHRALAEPDALEAVARLRARGGPERELSASSALASSDALAAARRRAEDALLQHEQAGEWTEAMTHYESASRRRENVVGDSRARRENSKLDPSERGRLRCLQGLGHLRALEKEAEALIASRPAARAELADMGAAAAWRLGRWDALENFLDVLDASGGGGGSAESVASGGDFSGRPGGEAAVGRVLLALHRRDAAGVARAATAARDAVITPLAAAAMEGSYRRAHPAVVQLHLIREAEEAMEAVASLDAAEETRDGANAASVAERKRGRGVALGYQPRVPRDALVPSSASLDVGVERLSDWDPRLALTPSAMATREPILALRRTAYAALGASAEDASAYTWLAQAKLCRASGHAGAAQLALFEARAALESAGERGDALENAKASSGAKKTAAGLPAPGMALAVEQAKLLWATGRQHRATVEIQEALDDAALRGADPVAASRAMLRLARWSAATGQRSKTDVLNIYSNVLRDQRHTEKANFHVAKYMDDLLKDAQKRERAKANATNRDGSSATRDGDGREAYGRGAAASRAARSRAFDVDERSLDYVVEVIQHYATSLRHGHRHAYESLPRMLTLWFDVGAAAAAAANAQNASKERKVATTATNSLRDFSQKLPLYTWLPALPQLTSRLCHPHGETRALIHELLHRLVRNFPNQVLWSMTAMARSTHPDRSAAAQRVLDRAKEGAAASARPLFEQSASLCDQLIRVCAFQPKPLANGRPAKSFSVKSEFPALRRLTPCDVLVPNQTQLAPTLPPQRARNAANPNHVPTVSEWNAFPDDVATIAAVEDDVPVLSSLQKPKKLTVIGSDGVSQSFLCKPKDDLRKDLRMMEFTTMLNRLLSRDAASRKRRLYLRTFAVVPLTEDCGLIEWVPHTTGLRHVIQALYVRDGLYHKRTLAEVKETHERLKATPTTWMREILKKFPPVFHRWFLNRWKDRPAAWHGARTAFAHTAAVWSMVGHVVGLGDRHGENILLDQESGDCVHVDFSCLFDKGLELETPEMVPFRLTQNIIDGLGAGGYEGVFMRASEITLSVLRSHREALMSVLETFVHDPLVEWSASRKGGARGVETASAGGRGKEALDKITSRLEGVVVGVGSAPSLPLSPQGQARRLIEEATSRKGQGSMYIWWMSWM